MNKIWEKLYISAKSVQNEHRISDYVSGGEVASAILSQSGKIYTGVCIDTCSALGICAERNAIFSMITNGEHQIDKVLVVMPNGTNGTPCGACRELMVQLMPDSYKNIEIMLDYKTGKTIKLGDITPEWWI
ncbi:MAG: cytidine deaminase [Ruminococcus flavefaciens]|nr:cytidine deaminase [Ruminococcus flavefaciens]